MERTVPITSLPLTIDVTRTSTERGRSESQNAVETAYDKDIAVIEQALRRRQSVLVECDRKLVDYLFPAIRDRWKSNRERRLALIVDGRPAPDVPPRSRLSRMMEQLADFVSGDQEDRIIMLQHLDVLTTTQTGLVVEAREAIPLLYENPEAVFLGFSDPSFTLPKTIRDLFPVQRTVQGITRDVLPKLITQREAAAIQPKIFDVYGLHKFVSGMNPIQLRHLLRPLGVDRSVTVTDRSKTIYADIRKITAPQDAEIPNVDLYKDIGGYKEVKDQLFEGVIELAQRLSKLSSTEDIKAMEDLIPRGILFYGAPGTGKTLFAKAMATALDATVFIVSGPELKSKWVGQSEENIRDIFRRARQSAPSVIVFDEIDSIAPQRGSNLDTSGVSNSMVAQLLTEMDGFRMSDLVFVVGTTNLPSSMDSALLRPGRFEFLIEVPLPNVQDRMAIAAVYSKKTGIVLPEPVMRYLMRRTEGLTGDNLDAVFRALKRMTLRTGRTDFTTADIDAALQRRSARVPVMDAEAERMVAIHEAGHALLAILIEGATPIEEISIQPNAEGALGYVMQKVRAKTHMTEREMRADICIGLGGTYAERMVLGYVSTGAMNDLQRVNEMARDMVENFGMSNLGPVVSLKDVPLSPQRLMQVEDEIRRILSEEMERAVEMLKTHRASHASLVATLLDKKVLRLDELADVVK